MVFYLYKSDKTKFKNVANNHIKNIIYFNLLNILGLTPKDFKDPLPKKVILLEKYIKRVKIFNKK